MWVEISMNRSLSEGGGAVNIEPKPILDRDCDTGEALVFIDAFAFPEGTTATLVLAGAGAGTGPDAGAGVPSRVSRLFRYSGRALIALVLEELSSRP